MIKVEQIAQPVGRRVHEPNQLLDRRDPYAPQFRGVMRANSFKLVQWSEILLGQAATLSREAGRAKARAIAKSGWGWRSACPQKARAQPARVIGHLTRPEMA